MTELRHHLSTLHRRYRSARYPGDLAADLQRSAYWLPRWLAPLGISATALVAGVALFFALDPSQILPWDPTPPAATNAVVTAPLTIPSQPDQPGDFDIVPSFQAISLPTPAPQEQAHPASTSQESA